MAKRVKYLLVKQTRGRLEPIDSVMGVFDSRAEALKVKADLDAMVDACEGVCFDWKDAYRIITAPDGRIETGQLHQVVMSSDWEIIIEKTVTVPMFQVKFHKRDGWRVRYNRDGTFIVEVISPNSTAEAISVARERIAETKRGVAERDEAWLRAHGK